MHSGQRATFVRLGPAKRMNRREWVRFYKRRQSRKRGMKECLVIFIESSASVND